MSNLNVDPNAIINDLLDQIKRLSADNAVLRVAIQQMQAEGTEGAAAPDEHTHDH
jgi:hypothetical protein